MRRKNFSWRAFCEWVDGTEPGGDAGLLDREGEHHALLHRRGRTHVEDFRRGRRIRQGVGALFCLTLLIILTAVVLSLPRFGSSHNPANNEVARRYIEQGVEETGALNLVAGMILNYRVFDTFGESSVLFLAATCVTMLLRRDEKNTTSRELRQMAQEERQDKKDRDVVLRTAVLLLLPVTIMFGFYVMLFGHLSPGGGFSGGAILGGGVVLYSRTFGSDNVHRFFNEHIYHVVKVICLMLYGLMLVYFVLTGVNGIPNHIPLGIPGHILSSGIILPINVLVGCEVACTIYAFYALFSKGEV